MCPLPTPHQTIGPFFHIALPYERGGEIVAPGDPAALRLAGRIRDGDGAPVADAMVEVWQADSRGSYDSPFAGFGRIGTDDDGAFQFITVKPGPVPGPGGTAQAPHLALSLFARGLLKHLVTRVYFPDEEEANAADPVLAEVEPERRELLVASHDGEGALRHEINLQGERETPFFDV